MYKPQLPTDNIYKFMSLAGLTLIILTAFFYLLFVFEMVTKVAQLEHLSNKLVAEADIDHSESKKRRLTTEEYLRRADKIQQEISLLKGKNEGYSRLLENLTYLGLLGLVLSSWGFQLWYYRVQIYQDQKLKHEVETLASNLKPTYQPLVKRSQNVR